MSEHRLGEIVIERPRSGLRISLRKHSGYRKYLDKITADATEDGLLNQYIIKPRNKTKYFSDHLGPLHRWLRFKVGQPWNKVYSELCYKLDPRGLSGQHILSHVWGFVELHVVLIDGVPYERTNERSLANYWREALYVHPETGILCIAHKQKKEAPKKRDDLLFVDSYHQYQKINDIWYLITFKDLTFDVARDVLLKIVINEKLAVKNYRRKIYAASKRQCNKKEIKLIRMQLAQA